MHNLYPVFALVKANIFLRKLRKVILYLKADYLAYCLRFREDDRQNTAAGSQICNTAGCTLPDKVSKQYRVNRKPVAISFLKYPESAGKKLAQLIVMQCFCHLRSPYYSYNTLAVPGLIGQESLL